MARFGFGGSKRLVGLLALMAAPLLVLGPAASGAAAPEPQVTLPADESPHDVKKEWWYYTGHLTGKDAKGETRKYGYELTFFRSGMNLFPYISRYIAHFGVTDLNRGTFRHDDRIALRPDVLPKGGGYDLVIKDWTMAGRNASSTLNAVSESTGYGLDLSFESLSKPALHGDGGIIPYGGMGTSYYYSLTNLKTSGTVIDRGEKIQVTGQSWFDRQWGDFKNVMQGWDWFSVQLDNGTQYMVYAFRNGKNQVLQTIGSHIARDGTATPIPEDELKVTPLGTWTSPKTGYTYSSGWSIEVPGGRLEVMPKIKNQELASAIGKYWEGACDVTGTINGQSVDGAGYTELLPPYPQM